MLRCISSIISKKWNVLEIFSISPYSISSKSPKFPCIIYIFHKFPHFHVFHIIPIDPVFSISTVFTIYSLPFNSQYCLFSKFSLSSIFPFPSNLLFSLYSPYFLISPNPSWNSLTPHSAQFSNLSFVSSKYQYPILVSLYQFHWRFSKYHILPIVIIFLSFHIFHNSQISPIFLLFPLFPHISLFSLVFIHSKFPKVKNSIAKLSSSPIQVQSSWNWVQP